MKEKINILFICRANCFRSKVSEAYFKKINKNKRIKVKSAGIIRGYRQSPIQIKTAKEFGINIESKPRGISTKLLKWTDILIIVADDVPSSIFAYEKRKKYIKKLIAWKVKDVKSAKDIRGNKRVINELIRKINKLNKTLEKKWKQ